MIHYFVIVKVHSNRNIIRNHVETARTCTNTISIIKHTRNSKNEREREMKHMAAGGVINLLLEIELRWICFYFWCDALNDGI